MFNTDTVGVIPRAMRYIFDKLQEKLQAHPDMSVKVVASFCEVYNEKVGADFGPYRSS